MKSFADLQGLLAPTSIAIIGASDTPASLGGRIVRMLQKFGYPGEIWPINPGRETVAGLRCYPNPAALPRPADLVVLAVSGESTPEAVIECAAAGIRNGIALANGFAEMGSEGIARQQRLATLCNERGFNLCGPNCLGIINTWQPMTASFQASLEDGSVKLLGGDISLVSQSGGTVSALQSLASELNVGFRYMVSSGNEAVLDCADFISAFADDPGTRVIAVYMEGCNDGPKLLAAMDKARAAAKPLVILKAGMTPQSARAAAAHTGILAGEGRVWDAVFREMGVIRADTFAELLDICVFLSSRAYRPPAGRNMAVVGFGGGNCVLTADFCTRHDFALPALDVETAATVKGLVTPMASIANPFDLTPQTAGQPQWRDKLPAALDAIAGAANIDALLFTFGALGPPTNAVCDIIREFVRHTPKTVLVCWGLAPDEVKARLAAEGIFVFKDPSLALRALDKVIGTGEAHSRAEGAEAVLQDVTWEALVPSATSGMVISEHECHRMLSALGLRTAVGRLITTESQLTEIAKDVGYPVAMKGISAAVTHRAKAGLIALDVRNHAEAVTAYGRLADRGRQSGIRLEGVYVQHMESGRLELLVSAFRDPVFGVMIACGGGGNLTEVIDDVVLARAPLSQDTAVALLQSVRTVKRTLGSVDDSDFTAMAEFLTKFSDVAACAPWQRFVLEINPVKWDPDKAGDGVTAVDGLLLIDVP